MAKGKPWLNKNLLTLCLGQNLKNDLEDTKKVFQKVRKEIINLTTDKADHNDR